MDKVTEMANTYHGVNQVRSCVNDLHKKTLGLFRPHPLDKPELVLKNDDGHLMCASFGMLGHVSTLHINAKNGVLVMFENGKTLADLSYEEYDEALKTVRKK